MWQLNTVVVGGLGRSEGFYTRLLTFQRPRPAVPSGRQRRRERRAGEASPGLATEGGGARRMVAR
ncbi:hypothetical protein E2562_020968 [Oryza meyeriana var. granulata]|uniref:Uncharacterized protein n=1 Tax=Oryza meyeriana var. granulata TaxID=110450 RepID=A0A6G1DYQ2_9ORYZ|nr:hypothetical protein E2562_020968 [Oryza meyeriana var. granulata]